MPVVQEVNEANIYTIIGTVEEKNRIALEAVGDVLIVKEDKFRTGYECKVCDGECYVEGNCAWCKGKGVEGEGEEARPCRICCASNIEYKQPGKLLCPTCQGRGGLIVAPQDAERRPTTGLITSMGPDVDKTIYSIGDRVLYTLFSGHAITFKQKGVVRCLHPQEIIAKIHGAGRVGDYVK